jgi:hypothetical protein
VFLAFSENSKRIGKSHLPDNLGLRRRDGAVFRIHHVCQTQLGHRENVGIECLSDKLAAHLCTGEVNAGGFIADEICDRSFRPKA